MGTNRRNTAMRLLLSRGEEVGVVLEWAGGILRCERGHWAKDILVTPTEWIKRGVLGGEEACRGSGGGGIAR
jgi:hypothetical protein